MEFSIVLAKTLKNGIGFHNELPWKLSGDLKRFKELTLHSTVIMGWNTFQSLPYKPLKQRQNIILSKSHNQSEVEKYVDTFVVNNFKAALQLAKNDKIFVIGGSRVFNLALNHPSCTKIFVTNVLNDIACDVFINPIPETKYEIVCQNEVQKENDIYFQYIEYHRRHEEYQYLDLVSQLLESGNDKMDRTGTGTLSNFGNIMRYSLRNHTIPLFTTKTVFWRGVVEELLWFISSSTDAKVLSNKRVKIWDGNGSRETLDKLGFTNREVGDLGPIYGHQWRHYGAEYKDCKTDYSFQGIDQLANVIQTIKTNPNDRRLIVCSWNVTDLQKMLLPPCHCLFQFYVFDGQLSCLMQQRSLDKGCGEPFNVASYSLLTHMVAQVCDLEAVEFIHVTGDTHIYKNHIEPLKEQLLRKPRPFPKLKINPAKKCIDDFTLGDFELIGYDPHPKIEMEMSV
jgi:dihydrofolate reductase / thymidylate synthase